MSTLIAYATKYGCTESCAQRLSQMLDGKVELYNLQSGKSIDLSQYDKVIIGSSVYIGRIRKEAAEFCSKNLQTLLTKKIALFICGSQEGEPLKMELDTAYPKELQGKAVSIECFGGEYKFSKMSFMEKTIVKMVAKSSQDSSNVDDNKIISFAQAIKSV